MHSLSRACSHAQLPLHVLKEATVDTAAAVEAVHAADSVTVQSCQTVCAVRPCHVVTGSWLCMLTKRRAATCLTVSDNCLTCSYLHVPGWEHSLTWQAEFPLNSSTAKLPSPCIALRRCGAVSVHRGIGDYWAPAATRGEGEGTCIPPAATCLPRSTHQSRMPHRSRPR